MKPMLMDICKFCKEEVIVIRSLRGGDLLCDLLKVPYWEKEGAIGKVVTPNGEVIGCELGGDLNKSTGYGYIPHRCRCLNHRNLNGTYF